MIQLATEIRWQDRLVTAPIERIQLSEQLGYDAVFTAEGFSDAIAVLGYVAARTRHLKLGSRVIEVTGRSPAMTALGLITLDHLAGGGRVIAGLGSASPQMCEGHHGIPWGSPVARMRDFVAILRQALAGEAIDHDGKVLSAPYRGPGNHGVSPAKLGIEPIAPIPIIIGASGPQMISLAAEIGDGWMPPILPPGSLPGVMPLLQKGLDRAGNGKCLDDIQIWAHVDVIVDDDVQAAMRPFKEYVVTWAKMQREFMVARGYGELADRLAEIRGDADAETRVQHGDNLLEPKRWEESINAVPNEYIDDAWLVGPLARIKERVKPWLNSGITGLVVRYGEQLTREPIVENLDAFRVIAEAAGKPRRR